MSKMYEIAVWHKTTDFEFVTLKMNIDELEINFPVIRKKFPREEGYCVQVLEFDKRITKINPEEIFC